MRLIEACEVPVAVAKSGRPPDLPVASGLAADPRRYGLYRAGAHWYRQERSYLKHADEDRKRKINRDGAALMAMVHLIHEQMDRLSKRAGIGPVEAQFLAWLLGESAERLHGERTL